MIELCKKYKIAVTGYFMLGGPGESKKTLNKTFQLAKDLDLERPAFFIFTPLPTTEVLKKIQNEQSIVDQKRSLAIDNFTFGATIESNDLTTSYVEKFHKKVYAYFMLRRIIRIIKKEKHRYFINLIVYITKGLMTGLDVWYMLGYFHMYYSESMTM